MADGNGAEPVTPEQRRRARFRAMLVHVGMPLGELHDRVESTELGLVVVRDEVSALKRRHVGATFGAVLLAELIVRVGLALGLDPAVIIGAL